MSLRSFPAVLTLGALPFAMACGGGSQPTPPPATTAPAAAAPAAGSGSVSGKVSFEGTPPVAEKVKTSADPKCAAMHPQGLEKKVVDVGPGGGLASAFVWVKSGVSGSYPPPADAGVLDQQGCTYHPHVLGLQAGQPLKILNSDDTLHNIHPRPTVNAEFNVGQPRRGMESTKTFDKQELMIPVGCDVHPWMRSYISVVSHPFFAVTKADGTYEIKGLPAGDYEIEVLHEKAAPSTLKVTVKAGQAAQADFNLKG